MLRIVLGYKTNQVSESPVVLYCGRDGNAALAAARKGHADRFIRITQVNGPHEYRVNVAQMIADEAAAKARVAAEKKAREEAEAKAATAENKAREQAEAEAAAKESAKADAEAKAAAEAAAKANQSSAPTPARRRRNREPETTT